MVAINRDTLISAGLHGGAAYLACTYLFDGVTWSDPRAITIGLVLGGVAVLVDQLFPTVSAALQKYNI